MLPGSSLTQWGSHPLSPLFHYKIVVSSFMLVNCNAWRIGFRYRGYFATKHELNIHTPALMKVEVIFLTALPDSILNNYNVKIHS